MNEQEINTIVSSIVKIVAMVSGVFLALHPTPSSQSLLAVLITVISATTLEQTVKNISSAYLNGKRSDVTKEAVKSMNGNGNGHSEEVK